MSLLEALDDYLPWFLIYGLTEPVTIIYKSFEYLSLLFLLLENCKCYLSIDTYKDSMLL